MPAREPLEVEVDCPACGNLNRAARRACRHCSRTGRVTKTLTAYQAVLHLAQEAATRSLTRSTIRKDPPQ